MKRTCSFLLAVLMLLSLTACQSKEEKWQEKYDEAMAQMEAMSYNGAMAAFEEAVALDPENLLGILGRAQAKYLSGTDLDGAAADFDQVLAAEPGNSQALLGKSEILLMKGDRAGAKALLTSALEALENPGETAERLAGLIMENGFEAPEEALEEMNELIEKAPDCAAAYAGRADLNSILYSGTANWNPEQVLEDYRRAYELDNENEIAVNGLAYGLYGEGRQKRDPEILKEALPLLQKVKDSNNQDEYIFAYYHKTALLLDPSEENMAAAEAAYAEALEKNPKSEAAWLGKIDLELMRGNTDGAEALIQEAKAAGLVSPNLENMERRFAEGTYMDSEGQLYKLVMKDMNGQVLWTQVYTVTLTKDTCISYDASGKETSRAERVWDPELQFYTSDYSWLNETGAVMETVSWTVNEEGVKVGVATDYATGEVNGTTYIYPEKDHMEIWETYSPENTITYRLEILRDEKGNELSRTSHSFWSGKEQVTSWYTVEYDEMGHRIKETQETQRSGGQRETDRTTVYEYEGNILKSVSYYNGDGSLLEKQEF